MFSSANKKIDKALMLQATVLYESLLARQALRNRAASAFEKQWKELVDVEKQIDHIEASLLYKREVLSDCWVKMGYVLYEKARFLYGDDDVQVSLTELPATAPLFDIDPIRELENAKEFFVTALATRAAWNPAEIYSLLVEMLLLGATNAEKEWMRKAQKTKKKPHVGSGTEQILITEMPPVAGSVARETASERETVIQRLLRSLGAWASQEQAKREAGAAKKAVESGKIVKSEEPEAVQSSATPSSSTNPLNQDLAERLEDRES
jgi:hypothetical protein